jgi:phage tail sheath protein FI
MPINPTFPGVYVQELPSSVHPITGVATSITAFIGRALRGPVNVATTINSFADFERIFGGLWLSSAMGYAVRDFYLNGGSQAIIVRLYSPAATDHATALAAAQSVAAAAVAAAAAAGATPQTVATAARTHANTFTTDPAKTAADIVATAGETAAAANGSTADSVNKAIAAAVNVAAPPTNTALSIGGLPLTAAYAGTWAENLQAVVDFNVSAFAATNMGLTKDDLFNLTVTDTSQGGRTEQFLNFTIKDSPNRIDLVLAAQSKLVVWGGSVPPTFDLAGLKAKADTNLKVFDDLTAAQNKLTADQKAGASAAVLQADQQAITAAQAAMAASDGQDLTDTEFIGQGNDTSKLGLFALEQVDLFNILCIPPYVPSGDSYDTHVKSEVVATAAVYCKTRRAMFLVDSPIGWIDKDTAKNGVAHVNIDSDSKTNAALFFPRFNESNILRNNMIESYAPSGAMAGIFARTDTQRGVWKAPAGTLAGVAGVVGLSVQLTNAENGELNPLAINCLRTFPAAGTVVWGSRTLQGDDSLGSQWKYIPVRRTALYIEESLYRGLQWVVFEPNDEPLWAQIRLNVGAFMHDLFRKGAFQGQTPKDAYLVKCDSETTTQTDINNGIVNILVGFAPLKPAEFVILQIEQLAGQIQV